MMSIVNFSITTSFAADAVIEFFVAIFATLGFAILFNAPRRELALCGFTGAVGWIVYFVMMHKNINFLASTVIATLVLTIFSRIFAVRRRNPVTVYLLTGIFPLVPGAGIYYTAYYFYSGNRDLFLTKGTETLETAIAIVFGIIFGTAIPQAVFNKLFSPKNCSQTNR